MLLLALAASLAHAEVTVTVDSGNALTLSSIPTGETMATSTIRLDSDVLTIQAEVQEEGLEIINLASADPANTTPITSTLTLEGDPDINFVVTTPEGATLARTLDVTFTTWANVLVVFSPTATQSEKELRYAKVKMSTPDGASGDLVVVGVATDMCQTIMSHYYDCDLKEEQPTE